MPSFVGNWSTRRYRIEDPAHPETIVLSITEDAQTGNLDGGYPRTGVDARLFGAISGNNDVWDAEIIEQGSSEDTGRVVFVLADDGNTIHGAWSSTQHNSPYQPWFGTRIP